ncbi:hypothetical protein P153DRAFT_398172 [Dothidotthia symphoricarpi CBS 119687]|uniref:Uncharacterized protein n=1 Tax=Dothidotthia symphoricarpi CBS 119687 TaxID=1392245 RepID=A0A6A6A8P8_9PLEO|nr:uncharacterized protein P153DRAFT_398172 [Dothidotthia symphoricarpi CBS 119687]KAF2127553.1 hypothetical protein P153DRAFT_398172 [Dothidotthia symphoricarpi CBS 119687]
MEALWPVRQPYGLSLFHQNACIASAATAPLPSTTTSSEHATSRSSSKARTHRLKKLRKIDMGVSSSRSSRLRDIGGTAKERRRRGEKSQRLHVKTRHDGLRTQRVKRSQQESCGATARPGALQSTPITIDSDVDEDTEAGDDVPKKDGSTHAASSSSRSRNTTLPPYERLGSIYWTPVRDVASGPSTPIVQPSVEKRGKERRESNESVATVDTTPYQSTKTKYGIRETPYFPDSHRRHKSRSDRRKHPVQTTPSPPSISSTTITRRGSSRRHSAEQTLGKTNTTPNSHDIVPNDGSPDTTEQSTHAHDPATQSQQDLVLSDIQDPTLRNKISRLTAVAPSIPICDIYHLLLEKNENFQQTLQELTSRASLGPPIPTPTPSTTHTPKPSTNRYPALDADDADEPMIKIDFSDPDFFHDADDAPLTPPPETRKSKKKPRTKIVGRTPKSTKKVNKRSLSSFKTRLPPHVARACANIRVKRATQADTYLRETSSDREFVVGDEVVFRDPDGEFYVGGGGSDGDVEMGGCDGEDGEGLGVGMRSRCGFDAGTGTEVLGGRKGRARARARG